MELNVENEPRVRYKSCEFFVLQRLQLLVMFLFLKCRIAMNFSAQMFGFSKKIFSNWSASTSLFSSSEYAYFSAVFREAIPLEISCVMILTAFHNVLSCDIRPETYLWKLSYGTFSSAFLTSCVSLLHFCFILQAFETLPESCVF